MKKAHRKLIPALAMLLVSTIMLSTTSFAWFTMSDKVQATGMEVTAEAPAGLVISNAQRGPDWGISATSANTGVEALQPGSTKDGVNFIKNVAAKTSAKNNAAQNYVAGEVDVNYVKHEFWVKSATDAAITTDNIVIQDVVVTPNGSANPIDKAIRVSVKVGGAPAIIFAPLHSGDQEYNVGQLEASTPTNPVTAHQAGPQNAPMGTSGEQVGVATIPGFQSSNPIKIEVYIWYEGEDTNCFSDNMSGITVRNLSVSFNVGYQK